VHWRRRHSTTKSVPEHLAYGSGISPLGRRGRPAPRDVFAATETQPRSRTTRSRRAGNRGQRWHDKRLRSHLRAHGFYVHGWGLGRNKGLTNEILDGFSDRLVSLYERHDQPVILIGWSFGGLLSRWLAHEHPDKVRHVVSLGSPWRPEGERTRVTGLFKSFTKVFGVSQGAGETLEMLRRPLPVPTTAIFSRSDGLLHWHSCAVDGADAENVAVHNSHVGLVSSPLVLAALTDRLAHIDSASCVPFSWRGCLQRMFAMPSLSGPSTQEVRGTPSAV
jgi:pimeloyl-ACP methyl ester carboxylesterase